jgi:UbiD family decarboxylase
MNLREFVKKLDKEGKLLKVKRKVNKKYEVAAIMKKYDGNPIIFENVESKVPVIANICSSRDLIAEALKIKKEQLLFKIAEAIEKPRKYKVKKGKFIELSDMSKISILIHYPKDGGPYITSGIFVIKDKEYGINSSFHRMMIIGKKKMVARILPRHFDEFVKRGNKEFAICVGCPTQVLIASAISCEIGKSELEIANTLTETDFFEVDGYIVPDSEIIMIAEITDERVDEGPFVDLTETYDIVRKERVINIKKIYTKPGFIYHALLPGGLEHKNLMGMPREPTIFREVNKVCKCKNVLITTGGSSWLHAIVQIEKKDADDGKKAIEAAFKGHPSLKHVVIVDDDINIYNTDEVEWAIATRFQADKNMILKEKQVGSSLDKSANLETRETSKLGIDATKPLDKKKEDFEKPKIPGEDKIKL